MSHFCDAEGRGMDAHVERAVADDLCSERVVLFEGDCVVDQLHERLVGGKCELLLFSQCRTGVRIGAGTEGTGVDGAVASTG